MINKIIECFKHRGMLAFVGSFHSLLCFFSFSKLLFTETVHIAPEHHKSFSNSSSFQPQIKPFLLSIKTLNFHILTSTK